LILVLFGKTGVGLFVFSNDFFIAIKFDSSE